jgi:cysteine-rich repeat protein
MHRVNVKNDIRTHRPGTWAISLVGMIIAAAMSGSCFLGTATNLCETSDRRCSPGQTCAAKQDVCIEIGGCGDGIVSPDKGEVCDDGGIIDGDDCSADCKSDESCGNNIIDAEETCDDGNRASGDGCSANCLEETCGDGFYNPANGEECDTGVDTQACNSNGLCTIPRCGDGYANTQFTPFMAAAPEECDIAETDPADPLKTISVDSSDCNGNNNGFEGPGSCRLPSCGDSYLNVMSMPKGSSVFEACDAGEDSPTCNGNNDVALNSDGTINQSNNLDSKCQMPLCGDGYANTNFTPPGANAPEQCDIIDPMTKQSVDETSCNGNNMETNGPGSCRVPSCGDGYTNTQFTPLGATDPEQCDKIDPTTKKSIDTMDCNGNNNDLDGPGSCRRPSCGDGYVNTMFTPNGTIIPEQCDKGDSMNNIDPVPCRTQSQNCDMRCNCT